MPLLNVDKALRSVRKTPVILQTLLRDVTQEQAQTATDGSDGWSVLFIVCHLRDYETIFAERLNLSLAEDGAHYPRVNNDAMIIDHRYAEQDLRTVLTDYVQKRQTFIAQVETLTEEQWARRGVHAIYGEGTVLDLVFNSAVHDLDHLEQIIRALGMAEV